MKMLFKKNSVLQTIKLPKEISRRSEKSECEYL